MYENLPDWLKGAPYAKSREAFRKHGLIQAGYCDVDVIDLETHQNACAVAPVVARKLRELHGYAIVVVRGSQIVSTTPHSQSMKAMGGKTFNESKRAVIDWGLALLECEAV